ncbi:MAG: hypothetical protein ACFFF4_03035 [Candidatus Thorarchaeota archaeon]
MLKFTQYKSQVDLLILKWPKACMSCGSTEVGNIQPKYKSMTPSRVRTTGIEGLGGKTETTINTIMKLKLYLCTDCNNQINTFAKIRGKGFGKREGPAFSLKVNPYSKFVVLDGNGDVHIADSPFFDMMKEINPILKPKKIKHPFDVIREQIPKDAVIPTGKPGEHVSQ